MSMKSDIFRTPALCLCLMVSVAGLCAGSTLLAQAPAAAPAARQLGTVKAISGSNITLATDAGQQVTVS
ncbi:MAG TPA: hypothetical protein VK608_17090, partial [Edaphobacter sp.]|nr:hypothetical protein [Edaphobacter sp.]